MQNLAQLSIQGSPSRLSRGVVGAADGVGANKGGRSGKVSPKTKLDCGWIVLFEGLTESNSVDNDRATEGLVKVVTYGEALEGVGATIRETLSSVFTRTFFAGGSWIGELHLGFGTSACIKGLATRATGTGGGLFVAVGLGINFPKASAFSSKYGVVGDTSRREGWQDRSYVSSKSQ